MNEKFRKANTVKRKKIGRPVTTGTYPMWNFRCPPELMAQVERWGEGQKPPRSRSEAIRALLERSLIGRHGRKS